MYFITLYLKGTSHMAKYDNSVYWEEYRDRFLLSYLREFSTQLNLETTEINDLFDECKGMSYKDIQSVVRDRALNHEPLLKLRTRFRTYSYKMRNNLSSISVTRDAKKLLDTMISEQGFNDSSDAITHLYRASSDPDLKSR